jgi:TPR repeat protein
MFIHQGRASDSGGDGEVCFNMGANHSDGMIIAAGFFETSCALGFAAACQRPEIASKKAVAQQVDSAVVPAPGQQSPTPNFATDLDLLRGACTRGNRGACAVMGFVSRCQQSDAAACDSAGNVYLGGVGVDKDLKRAQAYWTQACQIRPSLGTGYAIKMNGLGNNAAAQSFLDMACQGDATQCALIAAILQKGAGGMPRDDAKAHAFLDRGCQAGDGTSCQMLHQR